MPVENDVPSPDNEPSEGLTLQPQVELVADTASPAVVGRSSQDSPPTVTANLHFSETYQATFSTVPLPSADALERLARLYPEAPRIIFEEMQAQAAHRRAS